MIYSLGQISGAHINPASSWAFALRGVFQWRCVPLYWLAQILGATLAGADVRSTGDEQSPDLELHPANDRRPARRLPGCQAPPRRHHIVAVEGWEYTLTPLIRDAPGTRPARLSS